MTGTLPKFGRRALPDNPALVSQSVRPGKTLPWIVKASRPDLALNDWLDDNMAEIDARLLKHGAILFRGFRPRDLAGFQKTTEKLTRTLLKDYGDLPKEDAQGDIYKSTPYPADKMILFHNESSHLTCWPTRQFFMSVIVAKSGGETPIVDCRQVLQALPRHITDPLLALGLCYVRTFVPNFDVSWQAFFKTDVRAEADALCRAAGMEPAWRGEDIMQVRNRAPAVIRHPVTGEMSFFNQIALHHPSCLDVEVRMSMESFLGPDALPRNVTYGDGTPIPDAHVAEIGRVMDDLSVADPWNEGDLIMLDNMLVAHARRPFSGPRKIVVVLGDPVSLDQVECPSSLQEQV
ncbi:TauD/TfdA family dioxygenase [Consotaella aegiceratis]|uniref:TauD/TfdA family dioxygenase n=1 Tax=Consotaella aegiceratis TaxID=3097961 RepID=UPI002F3FF188